MTGADIKAAAMGAAFLARSEGTRIEMAHVMHAARRELAKRGVVVRSDDLGARMIVMDAARRSPDRLTLDVPDCPRRTAAGWSQLVAEYLASADVPDGAAGPPTACD